MRDYESLKSAVKTWLNRDDLTDAQLDQFISVAHNRIFREMRTPANEKIINVTIELIDYFDIPQDFLEAKLVSFNGVPLSRTTDKQIMASESSLPTQFARIGDRIYFDAVAQGEVEIIYWSEQDAPSTATPANDTLMQSPELYLFAIMCEAALFLMDMEGYQIWNGKYVEVLNQLHSMARNAELAGGDLVIEGVY